MSTRRPPALVPLAFVAAFVAALVAALVAAVGASFGASAVATTRVTAVGVGMREYRIALYRSRVLPGRVRLNIENLGEDAHDLQVVGPGATSTIRGTSPEVEADERHTLRVTLRQRGLYRLVCTIGDHASRGMVARLRVVRKL